MSEKKRVESKLTQGDSSGGTAAAAAASAGAGEGDPEAAKPPPPKQRRPSDPDDAEEEELPTPEYNGGDRAADVFASLYFHGSKAMEEIRRERRAEVLQDLTVDEVFREYFKSEGTEAINKLRGHLYACTGEYYSGAPLETRQKFAALALEDKYECHFKTEFISVEDIDKALLPLLDIPAANTAEKTESTATRTVDMSFLEPLKVGADESFLACERILVRNSMRRVFSLFEEDKVQLQGRSQRKPNNAYSAALVGSTGVGKSILFFLAALSQAKEFNIVYYRQSFGECASVFVMTPVQAGEAKGACVRIWFSRNVNTLQDLSLDLNATCVIRDRNFYEFLDGLHYKDDLVQVRNYDYLRPSGGMRWYKNEEVDKRLWILDGWCKEEAMEWLVDSEKKSIDEANAIYDLCGGNIRDMIRECRSPGDVKKGFGQLLRGLDEEAVKLASGFLALENKPGNPDRLRTMYEITYEDTNRWKHRMHALSIVDSPYLLRVLREKLGTGPFLHAYHLSQWCKVSTAAGVYFESLVHCQVRGIAGGLNIKYYQSEGTGHEGLKQLDAEGLYWVPSTQNFPLVGSALVRKNKLYVFQMTTKESKDEYNANTLRGGFASRVKGMVAFSEAVVYFVVPRGTNFRCPQATPDIRFLTHEIDTTDLTTVETSVRSLFSGL